jgi:hypothetical protein
MFNMKTASLIAEQARRDRMATHAEIDAISKDLYAAIQAAAARCEAALERIVALQEQVGRLQTQVDELKQKSVSPHVSNTYG